MQTTYLWICSFGWCEQGILWGHGCGYGGRWGENEIWLAITRSCCAKKGKRNAKEKSTRKEKHFDQILGNMLHPHHWNKRQNHNWNMNLWLTNRMMQSKYSILVNTSNPSSQVSISPITYLYHKENKKWSNNNKLEHMAKVRYIHTSNPSFQLSISLNTNLYHKDNKKWTNNNNVVLCFPSRALSLKM